MRTNSQSTDWSEGFVVRLDPYTESALWFNGEALGNDVEELHQMFGISPVLLEEFEQLRQEYETVTLTSATKLRIQNRCRQLTERLKGEMGPSVPVRLHLFDDVL